MRVKFAKNTASSIRMTKVLTRTSKSLTLELLTFGSEENIMNRPSTLTMTIVGIVGAIAAPGSVLAGSLTNTNTTLQPDRPVISGKVYDGQSGGQTKKSRSAPAHSGGADSQSGKKLQNIGKVDKGGSNNAPHLITGTPNAPTPKPDKIVPSYVPNWSDLGHGGLAPSGHKPIGTVGEGEGPRHGLPEGVGHSMHHPGGEASSDGDNTIHWKPGEAGLKNGGSATSLEDGKYWEVTVIKDNGSKSSSILTRQDLTEWILKTPVPDGNPDRGPGILPRDGSGKPLPLGSVFDGQGGIGHKEEGAKGDLRTLGKLNHRSGGTGSSTPGTARDGHTDPGPDGNGSGSKPNAAFDDMKAIISTGDGVTDPTPTLGNINKGHN
jgi:hypothetical protein